MRIGIVGPCTSGKSTLIANMPRVSGVELRHIAQEHSYVLDMWQRISRPDWLIYLDVSYPVTLRRKNLQWSEAEYKEQLRRLSHARTHAHLYIHTDHLTPREVTEKVLAFLTSIGIQMTD